MHGSRSYVAAEIEILHLSVRDWGVAFRSGMT